MAQLVTSFRTTTPSTAMTGRMTTKQVSPAHVHPDISCKAPLGHCMHVHQLTVQVCKPGESLALRKVKYLHNERTSVNRLPLTKQDILSQYSSCFEVIGHFPGDPYKFHLKPEHKPAQHAPRKVPIHLESAFKEEIESLVKLIILEEVREHTDWVNSYVIVEKDTGNHHSPNHTVKKKLRICLDPRDLNKALEREPYHTHSVDEITAKFQSRDNMEPDRHFPTPMEKCMDNNLTPTLKKIQHKPTHDILPDSQKSTVLSHTELPPDMESMPFFPGNQFLQRKEKSTLGTKLKPFVDTCRFTLTFTLGTNQQPFVETGQKPFTNSCKKHNIDLPFKDTHKKGGMTAMIGMTAIIAITITATLKTVNMITTWILICVESQNSFSNKLD